MITNEHNDGMCYKMTITYVLNPLERNEWPDAEVEVTLYGEDPNECFLYWEHNFSGFYTRKICIEDDSK